MAEVDKQMVEVDNIFLPRCKKDRGNSRVPLQCTVLDLQYIGTVGKIKC